MSVCPDRRPRRAWKVRAGDFIHGTLAPMRVTCWDGLQLCGVTPSQTPMRVTHPLGRLLDVTRLVDTDEPDKEGAKMTKLAFIALNTTGGNVEQNEIWELAVQLRAPGCRDMVSYWQFPVINLPRADGRMLLAGDFYGRYREPHDPILIDPALDTPAVTSFTEVARSLAPFLLEAHPVNLNPDAELGFLAAFLRRHGQPAAWRSTVPLTALAVGSVYGSAAGWTRRTAFLPEGGEVPHQPQQPINTADCGLPWDLADVDQLLRPDVQARDTITAPGRLALTVAMWETITAPVSPPGPAPILENFTATAAMPTQQPYPPVAPVTASSPAG